MVWIRNQASSMPIGIVELLDALGAQPLTSI
ncbi:hypothetical protein XNC3_530001 [Xenorhabdus nematophila F1]|nr:hypothetical protein XNC3_530001 [Xenorhabdus nematophila F1]